MRLCFKNFTCLAGLIIVFMIGGCSLTTFQSPRTVKPGKAVLGVGVAEFYNLYSEDELLQPIEIDLYARFGIFRKVDMGFKLSNTILMADLKYQILESPFYLSADLGGSAFSPSNLGSTSSESSGNYAIYTTLLFGSENLYGGLKFIYLSGRNHLLSGEIEDIRYKLPGFMIGLATPGKLKLLPEVNVYKDYSSVVDEAYWLIVAGLGLQYEF